MIATIIKKYKIHKNTPIIEILRKILQKIADGKPKENTYLPILRDEFKELQFGSYGIQKLLDNFKFNTLLDIGCGAGNHSDIFIKYKKDVTAIDYGDSIYFRNNKSKITTIIADFNECIIDQKFDAIWCSHVLEHQVNPNIFLKKYLNY